MLAFAIVAGQMTRPPTPPIATSAPAAPLWQLRSKHFLLGMPEPTDGRHQVRAADGSILPGISVLVREGFVVGHYDRFKVPAWVSMRWTEEEYRISEAEPYKERVFAPDHELPNYARAEKNYDFARSLMERGHMARHEDNKAWGRDNVDGGCLMSNVVPQHKDMNGEAWLDIEEEHRRVVANPAARIKAVWVIVGPVFRADAPLTTVGNGVAVPPATFKVIGWFGADGRFDARAYVVGQSDRRRGARHDLRTVDEVEALTGLDFFRDLDDPVEDAVEGTRSTELWN